MINITISKRAFTIFELVIVTWIIFFLFAWATNSLLKWKKITEYDQSVYQIISFIKDARSYWSTNYLQTATWEVYKVPIWWYWVEISNNENWQFWLVLFYNNNENTSFDTNSDEIIREWDSGLAALYFDKMYWSWSNSQWINWNSITQSWSFTWTIIFTNDWKSYISSGSWSNWLKNINFEFHMIYWEDKNYHKRRISFDRLEKIIRLKNYSKAENKWNTSF